MDNFIYLDREIIWKVLAYWTIIGMIIAKITEGASVSDRIFPLWIVATGPMVWVQGCCIVILTKLFPTINYRVRRPELPFILLALVGGSAGVLLYITAL